MAHFLKKKKECTVDDLPQKLELAVASRTTFFWFEESQINAE